MDSRPGRSCPIHYRYRPEQLCQAPESLDADVLYVVGGLYGNPLALEAIESLVEKEQALGRRVRVVFNGDFNWFNRAVDGFEDFNHRVLAHDIVLGNVEYELSNPSPDAGCGCAYPDFVDSRVVARSNRIMQQLQAVAGSFPAIQSRLRNAPRWRCLSLAGQRLLILHGDPESLAGWGLAHEHLSQSTHQKTVAQWFERTGADLMACTHTCLPAIWQDGAHTVINNGSAGMGNLTGDARGLVSRISLPMFRESPVEPLMAVLQGDLSVSLVPVMFNLERWLELFDRWWPEGSDAALSYRQRILQGTGLEPHRMALGTL
ncbi:metallophosphoesterase family protein [Marinobacter fonticola]|uniref:metallophosphoesterase family protein n=1 Tax=Marinobacter fonticola TaxID=2603215 RepID=UPI0011E805ED|nr:metallophosphoesterase family protein [Marinobacter fonticola]